MDRRTLLATGATAATLALAGCLGGDDQGSPEGVAEAYYNAETEDAIRALMHRYSAMEPSLPGGSIEISLAGEPEVVEENLDADEIQARVRTVLRAGVDDVADSDNAIVESPIEIHLDAGTGEGEDQIFVAVDAEDDEWALVGTVDDE